MSHGELAHLHLGTAYAHIVGSIFRETELLLKNNKIIVLPSFILQIEVRMDITLEIDVDWGISSDLSPNLIPLSGTELLLSL